MKFEAVAGQSLIKEEIIKSVNADRISHAYLFVENEGQGALPLAIAFAQYLNCENRNKNSTDSCGTCSSCYKAENIEHLDIKYCYPILKMKDRESISSVFITEWQQFIKTNPYGNVYDWLKMLDGNGKQGNIFAEECNAIIHNLNLYSFESQYKVQIIWQAEYLEKESNKLLKIIEEPPTDTIFILITKDKNSLLPTITSRTRELQLKPLSTNDITQYLKTKNYDDATINSIKYACEGNLNNAIKLASNEVDIYKTLFDTLMDITQLSNTVNTKNWIEALATEGRDNVKQFCLYCVSMLQNNIVSFCKEKTPPINNLSIEQMFEIIKLLDHTITHIERNANMQLSLHALAIKTKYILKHNTIITYN